MTRPVVLEDRLDSALRAGDAADRKRPVVPSAITDTVAPLGPNARAMLKERRNCTHQFGGVGVCVLCGASAYRQPSPRPTVLNLIADIAAGIRVLNERGMCIPEELIQERTANIVQGLLGNYTITGIGE